MRKKLFFLALILFLGLKLGYAEEINYQVGESSGKLLEFPAGVRPTGMGGAFVGLADDVNALFWNPAGLAQVIGREISMTHTSLFSQLNIESLAYSEPVAGGVGAFSIHYANYGAIEQYDLDEFNNPLPLNSSISPYAIMASVGWSKSLTRYFAMGFQLKGMQEKYGDDGASMLALDLGGYYLTGIRNLSLGVCVQNLQVPFAQRSLATTVRTGAAYSLAALMFDDDRLNLVMDLDLPALSPLQVASGFEYWYDDLLALRAGYRFNDLQGNDALNGFSVGFSFKLYFMEIDYAFLPNSNLGDTHRLALIARFSTALEQAEKQKRSAEQGSITQKRSGQGTNDQLERQPGKQQKQDKRRFYQYLFSSE